MPAFWLRPKRSPEGQCRSISSVSGRAPCGPSAFVLTSSQSSPGESRSVSGLGDADLGDAAMAGFLPVQWAAVTLGQAGARRGPPGHHDTELGPVTTALSAVHSSSLRRWAMAFPAHQLLINIDGPCGGGCFDTGLGITPADFHRRTPWIDENCWD